MVAKQTSPRSMQSIAGALLLALGFLLLFSNLDAVAAQFTNTAGTSGYQMLEMLPALVLALLHGLQSYVFDHARFLSALLQILVSFWPLVLVIIGALLLWNAFSGRLTTYKAGARSSAAGDRG